MTAPTPSLLHAFTDRDVLVTGHTGFKGAWLCLLLTRLGARVHGLALDPEPGALFSTAGVARCMASDTRGDVRDPAVVAEALARSGADIVLHLAAEALVRRAFRQPAETFGTNVMGTVNLLEAARQVGFEGPIVVVTTDKVYANDGREHGYDVQDRLGGTGPYSASKAACELVAASYRESFGLRVATVRAGNVIGGGDICEARLLPDCIRAWRRGEAVDIRRPEATRPWQHVLEPLLGYLHVALRLEDEVGGPHAWNLGPLEPAWPVRDVLDEAVEHWPGARWHASPEPGAPPEASRLDLEVSATVEGLAWTPRWDTRTAIRRTIGWEHHVAEGGDPRAACLADLDIRLGEEVEVRPRHPQGEQPALLEV